MKKRNLLLTILLLICLSFVFVGCKGDEPDPEPQPVEHVCQHVCPTCGKCTDPDCTDAKCADKCQGHEVVEEHECKHVCPECGKCMDPDCTDPKCADKCQGHEVEPQHECAHVCPICGKCLDPDCTDPACADKCQGHKVPVTGIALEGAAEMVEEGTQKLTVTVSPDDATEKGYTFASSDESVATVDAEGNVTALKAGTVVITVTSNDDETKKDELTITVSAKVILVSEIIVDGFDEMSIGESQVLDVLVGPENATNAEYELALEPADLAEFDSEGKLVAKKAGTLKVTATAKDGSGVKGEFTITISEVKVTEINIDGLSTYVIIGDEITLTISVKPENASDKSYDITTSDAEVLALDAAALKVTALKEGKAKITVSAKDGSGIVEEITVSVAAKPTTLYVANGASAETKLDGVVLDLGHNLFGTIADAVAYADAGSTIILLPGEYAETVEIAKALTIKSLLAGNPVADDTDYKDAVKAAVVKGVFYVNASDITLEGLTFTGAARVARYGTGDLSNFKFANNYVHDTADATVAWGDTRYSNGVTSIDGLASLPGFICLAGSWSWAIDTVIENNKFENVSDTNVYIICTDSALIKGNSFVDCDRDAVRFDYNNNIGEIVIEDNYFNKVKYNGVYLRSYGAGDDIDVKVLSNYFGEVGTENPTSSRTATGAFATAAHQEATNAKFTFKYNIFDKCDGYINIRGNVTASASFAKTFTLDVSYNAFITADATTAINKNLFGSDTVDTNFAIGTFNNNFYGTDYVTGYAPADAQFENIKAKDTATYMNIIALDKNVQSADAHLPAYEKPQLEVMTIAAAYGKEKDDLVFVEGTVVYEYGNGFLLRDSDNRDEANTIYVVDHDSTVKLGDKVTVLGTMTTYNSTKRLYANTVTFKEAGTFTPSVPEAVVTEEEWKALDATNPVNLGKEYKVEAIVTKVSGTYVTLKVGSTTFTAYTKDANDAAQYAAYIDSAKTVTVSVFTYMKASSGTVVQCFPIPDTLVASEGLAPAFYIIDPNKPAYGNRYQKLADVPASEEAIEVRYVAGEYAEELVIDRSNITIASVENKGITGYDTRKAEATFNLITIAAGVKNVTIDGLHFTGSKDKVTIKGGNENISIYNCLFEASSVRGISMEDGLTLKNLEIIGNKFVVPTLADARHVRFIGTVENATIQHNTFVTAQVKTQDIYFDAIRMNNIAGIIDISYNDFSNWWSDNTTLFLGSATCSATKVDIKYNDFTGSTDVEGCVRSGVEVRGFNATTEVNIEYNNFKYVAAQYMERMFLIRTLEGGTANVNIRYNAFLDKWCDTFVSTSSSKGTQNIVVDYNWFCEGYDVAQEHSFATYEEFGYEVYPPVYNLEDNFGVYGASWDTSYGVQELNNQTINSLAYIPATITYSNVSKQTGTITTMPVVACKGNTQYVTIEGAFEEMEYVEFELVGWTTSKKFSALYLEYTKDGETWELCSAKYGEDSGNNFIVAKGLTLASNVSIKGAKAVRFAVACTGSSNMQIAVKEIKFAKEAPAESLVHEFTASTLAVTSSDYLADVDCGFFTIKASEIKNESNKNIGNVTVDASAKYIANSNYIIGHRVKFNGNGTFDYRSIQFTIANPAKVYIVALSSSSSATTRPIDILKADGTKAVEAVYAETSTLKEICYTLGEAGTYAITGTNGAINVFYVRVEEDPNADYSAPVITLSAAVQQALASKKFVAGSDETATFTALLAGISANDNKDGAIVVTQDMVNLGGLNPAALVAGDYNITITVKDAANNEGKLVLPIHVEEAEIPVYTIDFADGTVGSGYTNAKWTQEVYNDSWTAASGKMNCREKDGVRVVNFYSGYSMTYRYIYQDAIGTVNKITFKAGNYFDGAQNFSIKVILVDGDGVYHYILGDSSTFATFPVTTGLVDQELTFDAVNAQAFVIVAKSTINGNAYLYVGDINFYNVETVPAE